MIFQNPAYLYGLILIAIPIIIHFFNLRKHKTVYYSNIKVLQEIKKEHKSKSRITRLILLLLRIAMIILFVLAFARPQFNSENAVSNENEYKIIYIDNSISMNTEVDQIPLIEKAKSLAGQIINTAGIQTKFMVITNDFTAREKHFYDASQAIKQLSLIRASGFRKNISLVCKQIENFMIGSDIHERCDLFCFSDFQKNSTDISEIATSDILQIKLTPLHSIEYPNLSIDSCWFRGNTRKFGESEELFVRIQNHSEQDYTGLSMELFINDSLRNINNFDITGRQSVIVPLAYTNNTRGEYLCKLRIEDYPVRFDNEFYFNYVVKHKIHVLNLSGKEENKYLKTLFMSDENIRYQNTSLSDLGRYRLNDFNLIIMDQVEILSQGLINQLLDFVSQGGSFVFIPSFKQDFKDYNQLLQNFGISIKSRLNRNAEINKLETADELFKNVFENRTDNFLKPEVFRHFIISQDRAKAFRAILQSNYKTSILSKHTSGSGKFYVFSMPIDSVYTDLGRHPLFVPIFYNIALQSLKSQTIYYTLGLSRQINITEGLSADKQEKITIQNNNTEFIPDINQLQNGSYLISGFSEHINQSGFYQIAQGGKYMQSISFNHHPDESDIQFFLKQELEDRLKRINRKNLSILDPSTLAAKESFIKQEIRKTNWKILIILLLIFIMAESFFSTRKK